MVDTPLRDSSATTKARRSNGEGTVAGPRRSRRTSVLLTPEDSFWNIVGMIDDDGPTDVSSNKHPYLATALAPQTG